MEIRLCRLYTKIDTVDALHGARLLTVEEKPFKRLTKRLLGPSSPIQSFHSRLPTPPVESSAEGGEPATPAGEDAHQKTLEEHRRFREDVILDFAAFESSLARIQFLRTSNEKERERYAAEKLKIEATAQDVRNSTAKLQIQLEEAQKTLAVRKTYDVLADKITNNPALKPRDEQHVNLEKLRSEIEELERESREYSQTWNDRKEQFHRVLDEGMRLRRLIRDEKEEPDRQEGEESLDTNGPGGLQSTVGTPRPDQDGRTPMHHGTESGPLTPRPNLHDSRRGTPQPDDPQELKPPRVNEDTDMADEGEVEEAAAATAAVGNKVESAVDKAADRMDTS